MLGRAALISLLSCILTINMVTSDGASPKMRLCSAGKVVGDLLEDGSVSRVDANGSPYGAASGSGCQCDTKGLRCPTPPQSGYLPAKTPTTCVELGQSCA
ncbi:hypothetical protein PGTUg99_008113 [Puccinia graminis f. sp. tritici]|nr:hypothetical protein PGTUg99_008113 [Puccinia graminis f. sp. tritici]